MAGNAALFVIPGGEEAKGANLVYRAVNSTGDVIYVGITKNFERRAVAHLAEKGIQIRAIPGLTGLSRFDSRAVEQVLIEEYGLGKDGGTLLNKINSIATRNPIYRSAIRRGTDLLQSIGYPGF